MLILQNTMYTDLLHGISERTTDIIDDKIVNIAHSSSAIGDTLTRSTRVSLTIRYVPKLLKLKLKFGK